MLAFLDADTGSVQKQVDVNLDPPQIHYSDSPAVLLIFMGEPQFKPVVAAEPDLMFAVNTNWDVFFEPASKGYFLLNEDHWLTSQSAEGLWTVAESLPARMSELPEDENWAEVRKHVPAKKAAAAARVIASTEPAELVLTAGQPQYDPIPQTKLLEVTNTESLLILDSSGGKFYFQAAGRWFRAPKLDGPWSAASSDLPEDFTKIPDDHPLAFVKATVPGTHEAADAVLLASVPQSTYVDSQKPPTLVVTYQGEPNFQSIPTTTVKYAVNSPYSVFLVDNGYYCCDEGVWFSAKTATGPWAWCSDVPKAIYTIPASSPAHNVTYVTVKESTPDTIVYTQTSGYSGEYVAATGVLMIGAGLVAAELIDDCHVHYCYPYPAYYSYGCGAVYHHGYGGYYYGAASSVYGPYGGVGYAAAYNPATGTYARGAYSYGPYGSAGYRAAYNPYTDTGAVARGASGARGSAAGVRTTEGTGAAAWDTNQGQGAVAKTKNDNVYAARNGNVYKKDADGNWSTNTGEGGGWQPAEKPETKPTAKGEATRPKTRPENTTKPQRPAERPQTAERQSLDSVSRSRERGNSQVQRRESFQRPSTSGASQRSGGLRNGGGQREGGGLRR